MASTMTLGAVRNQLLVSNWPVNISVFAARMLVAGGIWAVVVALSDDPRVPTIDVRVFNLRFGLWLFLAGLLWDAYRLSYATPAGFRGTVRLAAKESFKAALSSLWITPLSLLFRGTLIMAATWWLVMLGGPVWLPYTAAFLPTITIALFRRWLAKRAKVLWAPVLRGTHLGSYAEAEARAAELTRSALDKIGRRVLSAPQAIKPRLQSWADRVGTLVHWGVDLPLLVMDPHYLMLGVAGTGKTLLMRLLMQSVLVRDGRLSARAVVYDAKRDAYSLLMGMGVPHDSVEIMNAADARSAVWDTAGEIETKDDAHNIAIALVPQPEANAREQVFFVQAVQAITTAVMWTLHRRSPGSWQLHDVLKAVATPGELKRFFEGDAEGLATYQRYFTEADETVGGIVSTLDTKLITPYESIARIWSRGGRRVRLKKWATDPNPSVLILGTDANRAAIKHINQAMFSRIVQLITAKAEDLHDPNHETDSTWFFLDEMRFAGGELPLLGELVALGRTKGSRVVMASQDIDGLYDVYGQHKADELLALCGNVAVFRLMSPRTREWAAKLFGEYEGWEQDYSESRTISGTWPFRDHSKTYATNNKRVKKESILPSEFFDLPKAGPDHGLPGFFATPEIGAWRGPIPWEYVRMHLKDADTSAPGFVPRPPEHYCAPPTAPASTPGADVAAGTSAPVASEGQSPPGTPQAPVSEPPQGNPPGKRRPGRLPW